MSKKKFLFFLLVGFFFGFLLIRSEIISWYRVQEMFRFEGFHMFGIVLVAVPMGMFVVWYKHQSEFYFYLKAQEKPSVKHVLGGALFGAGWSMAGACAGPLFAMLGYGYWAAGIAILFSIIGTLLYGYVKNRIPH